jgi:acyl-CoA reductase-like NAD-dependent aldehyde dehydrogenase
MTSYTMTINGESIEGGPTFEVINPSKGSSFAVCPDCTKSQLDDAMKSALRAFPEWGKDKSKRIQSLHDCAETLKSHGEMLAEILTREQGKPLKDALFEINRSVSWIEGVISLDLQPQIVQDDSRALIKTIHKPIGVVAAITPWNFPILLALAKIIPALLVGDTVVLKPSPFTPLATLKMGEIFRDLLPAGVLNIVSGGDELGSWMTMHPIVRKISFTGSVETGKKVAQAAAPDLKRIDLELGGNDPAIVLPDVDPQKVADKLFWGAFRNNGQVCIDIKRLYIHEKIFGRIVQEIAAIARVVKVGDGFDPTSQLGPVNNKPQFERVIDLVEDAKKSGATIVTGGKPFGGPGYFYPPTIVTDISEGTRLVDEEQFGPVLPIMSFSNIDEALERANATRFGLGGSIWTNDVERGADLASKLECGTGWVNQHGVVSPTGPLGGVKWSGIGYQFGIPGLEELTEMQVINLNRQ